MKALIFDMDGVLVDSEPLWRLAERETFAEVGLELTDADCESTMGMRTDEVVDRWYHQAPWQGPSPEEVVDRLEGRMRELITERASAMPGVEHTVALARASGLSIGLATSSAPPLIEAVLARLGLVDAFAVTHSALEEEMGKPHPAVYLTTARRLGVAPSQCVAVEDSSAGVRSAKGAGMRVIAVPPPHLFDDPGYDEADIKLRSLEELTPEMIR
jgi:sugar-phosphatase